MCATHGWQTEIEYGGTRTEKGYWRRNIGFWQKNQGTAQNREEQKDTKVDHNPIWLIHMIPLKKDIVKCIYKKSSHFFLLKERKDYVRISDSFVYLDTLYFRSNILFECTNT